MPLPNVYWWSKTPFIRMLTCLIAGILLQWEGQFPLPVILTALLISFCGLMVFSFLPLKIKHRWRVLSGLLISSLIAFAGSVLVWKKDIRHTQDWIGKQTAGSDALIVCLEEPLVEKANSYKAVARIKNIYKNKRFQTASGRLLVYCKKDSSAQRIGYGALLVFKKELQAIKNAGNPGGFDYERYSLFQEITHQVYLLPEEFEVLPQSDKNVLGESIVATRRWLIQLLRKFIKGDKEQGLAEALIIGYKDDLDKNLVQAYANTGVVHVIAISGLHLGLIYWLLLLLTRPLKGAKIAWLRLVIILSCLWLFSLLAGAQPSVLRSAVMFSFIAWGQVISRKGSVYNTLALSAFLLLCYNPFWLWDVGFQLSYTAVLSIMLFFRPVYAWVFFAHPLLDFVWKLNAVTLSAQLLTLPLSIYHFHQVPTLFLFTNLVAVPLSSAILIGEILLCVIFFIEPLALWTGSLLSVLIRFMNDYIERFDRVSFAVWQGLYISVLQTVLLTAIVILICFWLMEKKIVLLWMAALCLFFFVCIRSISFIEAERRRFVIVYNVPKHSAMDLVNGKSFRFTGDPELVTNEFLLNFHMQPARVLYRMKEQPDQFKPPECFEFAEKCFLFIDSACRFLPAAARQKVDMIVLSKNPKLYISALEKAFSIRLIVIDSSVPAWKARLWKKDCDALHIPCYDVSQNGAFMMKL